MTNIRETREWLAKKIAGGLMNREEVRELVAHEISLARMALPITANYDPKNEGYRRMSGFDSRLRDLMPMAQERMFEIAYFMWDSSLMLRRLAVMDKSFIFNGQIKLTSEEPDVQEILDAFMQKNKIGLRYPERAMWLSLLGEQVWPVSVNPYNGAVTLAYEDPSDIVDVLVNPTNIEEHMLLELRSRAGRETRKATIIRESADIKSKAFGRLDGECFFWRINAPPNSPRGRSDYLTLFDWIDGLERYGFNYLERAEFLLNFVWDVTLKGMNADQIRDWLRDNPPPTPGSIRAHNENVEWDAVAPDIKATDFRGGYDMGKGIVMGGAGRPSSWFGEGGKAYQTEAEQFGQVPIADLESRSYLHQCNLEEVGRFVVDQAVSHGRLSEEKAKAGCRAEMPEISKKDLTKLVNGVPQLTTALTIAQNNKWIMPDEATRLFCFFASYLGYEIDPQTQIDAAAAAPKEEEKDYDKLLSELVLANPAPIPPADQATVDNARNKQDFDNLGDSIQARIDAGAVVLRETIEGQISGLQKELSDDISTLNARMSDRPSINITIPPVNVDVTVPPVNVDVNVAKGKVKKTINYKDFEGNVKSASVTEEDL